MLTVKTYLRPSGIHGLGVFAAEFIPAGTVVWEFRVGFDFRVSEESVASLPETARNTLLHYSAKWGGGYVISADDARFLNHSETPNLRTQDDPDVDIAIGDILPGEELLEDYREFDDTFAGRPIQRGIATSISPAKHTECAGINGHNLNNIAKVRPTSRGLDIIRLEQERASKLTPRQINMTDYLRLDKDGWLKLPLWQVMEIFGPHIQHGAFPVLEMRFLLQGATPAVEHPAMLIPTEHRDIECVARSADTPGAQK